MNQSNVSKREMNSFNNTSLDNSIPDFLKNEKIGDALKNIFRQELQIFIHNRDKKQEENPILCFPALLSSRSRFMLHTITSTDFLTLATFSIGEEPSRRCCVISRDLFNPDFR